MIGYYILCAVIIAFLIYCSICIVWTMRMREVAVLLREIAVLLREILESSGWGDLMKQLVSEDYVKAVMRACKMVMGEAR